MVGGIYKQRKLLTSVYIVIILFTFIAGIHYHPLHRMLAAQLLQKGDKDFGICPVCGYVIADNVFTDSGHIYIITGL